MTCGLSQINRRFQIHSRSSHALRCARERIALHAKAAIALKTGTRYGGDYLVHWTNKQEAWRMRGEIYVILSPDGSLYAP
jgi:hypothetical protein